MAKQVTFYYHKDCDGCEELKPELKKIAKSKKWKYKAINVEKCRTKFCDEINVVPVLVVNGKKLNEKQMLAFLEREL